MTALQKLLVPARSAAISERGADDVGGPVVRAADVLDLRPAELVAAYGLAGRPFETEPEHVDVLRFEPHSLMRLETPSSVGERPWPTYEHGFLQEGAVPVWLLARTRVPLGTEFWRIRADGEQRLLSAYAGPAAGWRGAKGYQPPLDLIGRRARWQGLELPAELPDGDRAVDLVHVGDEGVPAGFEKVRPMVHHLVVSVDECESVFELELTARAGGVPVRVLRSDGQRARVLLVDPDQASVARLAAVEIEPGAFEALVAVSELTDTGGVRRELAPTAPGG